VAKTQQRATVIGKRVTGQDASFEGGRNRCQCRSLMRLGLLKHSSKQAWSARRREIGHRFGSDRRSMQNLLLQDLLVHDPAAIHFEF
jgi:hypothetical protein